MFGGESSACEALEASCEGHGDNVSGGVVYKSAVKVPNGKLRKGPDVRPGLEKLLKSMPPCCKGKGPPPNPYR